MRTCFGETPYQPAIPITMSALKQCPHKLTNAEFRISEPRSQRAKAPASMLKLFSRAA
jgi:hypothetical protein